MVAERRQRSRTREGRGERVVAAGRAREGQQSGGSGNGWRNERGGREGDGSGGCKPLTPAGGERLLANYL